MFGKRAKTDAEIIFETLAGNRDIFALLIDRYTRMAYSIAFARLGNHTDAEDAVQEAWLQAFQSLPSLREPDKFLRWFAAIARNTSVAVVRKRQPEVSLEDNGSIAMVDARMEIETEDLHRALWSQIVNLTPDMREILTLHYFAGMTTEEIAESIGQTRETVKKRLQRARTALSSQTLHTLFEPAQRDEERLRKRAMAAILALPLPRPVVSTTKRNAAPPGGLAAAIQTHWILTGIVLVLLAGLTLWVFAPHSSSPSLRDGAESQPAMPAAGKGNALQKTKTPVAPPPAPPLPSAQPPVYRGKGGK